MKLTIGQKAHRVLTLLIAMDKYKELQTALEERGFTEADKNDGWRLLRGIGKTRLRTVEVQAPPDYVAQADAFENVWYPVCRLTLERHHPAAAEYLFDNLPQSSGPEVVLSVSIFLDRLAELGTGQSPVGEDGIEARKLLLKRGLTPQIVAETQAIVDRVEAFNPNPANDVTEEEQQQREDALWSWYLEWSGIARLAITSRRTLRGMGFLRSTRSADDEETEIESTPDDTDLSTLPPAVDDRETVPPAEPLSLVSEGESKVA